MKKSVLLFALLAVAVGVRAQLVEHYDNPQRFQITEFEDHIRWNLLIKLFLIILTFTATYILRANTKEKRVKEWYTALQFQ